MNSCFFKTFLSFFSFTICCFASADLSEEFSSKLAVSKKVSATDYFTHGENTLYISPEAILSLRTSRTKNVKITKDVFFHENEKMFNKNIGGYYPNHLFVSLEIYFSNEEGKVDSVFSPLYYNQESSTFCFSTNGHQKELRFADFCNHPPKDWKKKKYKNGDSVPIKIVSSNTECLEKLDGAVLNGHSEPGALSALSDLTYLANFMKESIPGRSAVQLILYRFHSYLDFCKDCQSTLQAGQFFLQEKIKKIEDITLSQNFHLLFIGQANKCYKRNDYNESLNGYHLKRIVPFEGSLDLDADGQAPLLYCYIRKAVSSAKFIFQPIYNSLLQSAAVIKVNSPEVCWSFFKTEQMYDDSAKKLTELFELPICELDLSGNRFGVDPNNDDGDDGFTYSDGSGFEVIMPQIGKCIMLESLNLSENAFRNYDLISGNIGQLINLRTLNLSNTFCGKSGVLKSFTAVFSNHLSSLVKLEELNLSRNTLYVESYRDISSSLGRVKTLQILNLSQNQLSIDTEGWGRREEEFTTDEVYEDLRYILLPNLPNIRVLDISDNGFDNLSTDDLLQAMSKGEEVYISNY